MGLNDRAHLTIIPLVRDPPAAQQLEYVHPKKTSVSDGEPGFLRVNRLYNQIHHTPQIDNIPQRVVRSNITSVV